MIIPIICMYVAQEYVLNAYASTSNDAQKSKDAIPAPHHARPFFTLYPLYLMNKDTINQRMAKIGARNTAFSQNMFDRLIMYIKRLVITL